MADTKITLPKEPADVSKWKESQGFIEEVIDLAKRVVSEISAKPGNAEQSQKLLQAKTAMAASQWEKAYKLLMEISGGKGPVANKSMDLASWSADVLAKSDLEAYTPSIESLDTWAGTALKKADMYASAIIEAAVRRCLYDEMYHTDNGLDDDLLCEHVADNVISSCSYGNKEELKQVVSKGGRAAIVAMCRANIANVRAISSGKSVSASDRKALTPSPY